MTKANGQTARVAEAFFRKAVETPSLDEALNAPETGPVLSVPVGRLLDLGVFLVAFDAYQTVILAQKRGGKLPLLAKGVAILRRYNREMTAAITEHLAPLGERPDAGAFRALLAAAQRSGDPQDIAGRQANLLKHLMPWVRTRPAVFAGLFSGSRTTKVARELAGLCDEEAPESVLNKAAGVTPISGITMPRKWLMAAAADAGVGLSGAETVLTDAAVAQNLGEDLQGVESNLQSVAPNTPEAADLQGQKSEIINRISDLAEASSAPDAVLGAAAASARTQQTNTVAEVHGLTQEQEAVMHAMGKVIVGAGAGSGKTKTLVATIDNLIKNKGIRPGRILACSFTRAASAQLGVRVEKAGIPSGVDIGTTHHVARAIILNNRPSMAGAVKNTKGADTCFKIALKQISMDVAGHQKKLDEGKATLQRIERIQNWRNLDILKSFHDQISKGRPLSEKQLAVLPKFENRGGGGYRRWADEQELETHWAKLAADFGEDSESPKPDGFSKYWTSPIGEWFNVGLPLLNEEGKPMGAKAALLAVDNFKNSGISVEAAKASEGVTAIVALYGCYEWLKKFDPVFGPAMDYTDQLQVALEIMETDPKALATEQARYDAVMVDEAQDLNDVQFRMFKLIGDKAKLLSFIGDDKQSIYAFRGAKPKNYVDLSKNPDFQTKLMTTNFRSGSAIVNAANKLIAHNEDRQIPMTCNSYEKRGVGAVKAYTPLTHEEGAKVVSQEMKGHLDSGESLVQPDGTPTFGVLVRNNAEADAYTLSLIARGIPYRMLKRDKGGYFGKPVVRALSAWIRLIVGGSDAEMNDAFTEAHMTPGFGLDKAFEVNLAKVVKGMNYFDWAAAGQPVYQGTAAWLNRKVEEYVNAVRIVRASGGGDSSSLIRAILELKGPKGSFIDALIKLVDEDDLEPDEEESEEAIRNVALAPVRPLMLMADSFKDPANMLRFIAKMKGANEKVQKKDPTDKDDWKEPAVIVGTTHGWKGLEAKHVYVCMAGGIFPNFKTDKLAEAGDNTAHDEERRLAYVAITRGADTTTVICPQSSYLGKPAGMSRFVSEACIPVNGAAEPQEELDRAVSEANAEAMGKTAASAEEIRAAGEDFAASLGMSLNEVDEPSFMAEMEF